jgi:hypothetical protein
VVIGADIAMMTRGAHGDREKPIALATARR